MLKSRASRFGAPRSASRRLLVFGFLGCFAVLTPRAARAEKIWVAAGDGLWRDGTNWSGHLAPDITSFIKITNAITKTITIDSETPATNLTVQKITITAPPGNTNTLLLSSLGVTNPLVLQTGLELLDGAAIRITNSALQTLLTNDHINLDGSLTLDTGVIDFGDTTVTARVGRVTSGILTINGGTVSAGAVTIGGLTNSSGFLVVNGGVLNISSFLSAGRSQGTTGTVAVAGGQVNVLNDDTRVGDDGVGFMTVSNSTLLLNNLQVGRDSVGSLSVLKDGVIQVAQDTVLGRFTNSFGTLVIDGGQLLCSTQRVIVGRAGTGQLSITSGLLSAGKLAVAADATNSAGGFGTLSLSGGTTLLSSNLVVGSPLSSTGQVSMAGGLLTVTNSAKSAAIVAASGTILVTGGTVTADTVIVTNSGGELLLRGGTLATRQTAVANGAPFVVGDGLSPATLNLQGGTHSFAGGLVISSNATLSGCGTIIGTIINHGIIATNCGGALVSVPMSIQTSGQANLVSFPSAVGSTYTLQYKNLLTDLAWTDLPPSTNGTGGTILLRDTTSVGSSRFYRLKIQ